MIHLNLHGLLAGFHSKPDADSSHAIVDRSPQFRRLTPAPVPSVRAGLLGLLVLLWLWSGCAKGSRTTVPDSGPTPTATATPTSGALVRGLQPSAVAVPGAPAVTTVQTAFLGEVVAEQEVPVDAETSGRILSVDLAVGRWVVAGEVVARIDPSLPEARREQALASLEAAQAKLELLKQVADETEIEAARAAVAAAQAAYDHLLAGPTDEELAAAETAVRQAEAELAVAQAAYDQVAWNPLIASLPQTQELEQAMQAVSAAQTEFEKLFHGPSDAVIADAYAAVATAKAVLRRLEVGPDPAEIESAEATVRQAETALYVAQLELEKTSVRAPINGIVARVDVTAGTVAAPGTRLGLIITPDVKVETPVEEAYMAAVQVGQPARISVTAYPNRSFDGEVVAIAPRLDPDSHTVLVTLRAVGDGADDLAPGMVATVEFAGAALPGP